MESLAFSFFQERLNLGQLDLVVTSSTVFWVYQFLSVCEVRFEEHRESMLVKDPLEFFPDTPAVLGMTQIYN